MAEEEIQTPVDTSLNLSFLERHIRQMEELRHVPYTKLRPEVIKKLRVLPIKKILFDKTPYQDFSPVFDTIEREDNKMGGYIVLIIGEEGGPKGYCSIMTLSQIRSNPHGIRSRIEVLRPGRTFYVEKVGSLINNHEYIDKATAKLP